MYRKAMKLINPHSGLMECRVCGARHFAMIVSGSRYARGSWQCQNGCKGAQRQRSEASGVLRLS